MTSTPSSGTPSSTSSASPSSASPTSASPSSASPSLTSSGTFTGSDELVTSQGRTTIADAVVSKIAGIATREISGVHALGGGSARAVGALRDRLPGNNTDHAQGITVQVGEKQAAVDVTLVAEYGVGIADLAAGIRRNVIAAIERMTGLEVTEVNIEVADVHVPSDDDQGQGDSGSSNQ